MASASAVVDVYIVKVSDVPCSRKDSFAGILEKAAKFYSTFVQHRSFRACRDDLDPSDATWAILCFKNKDDAVNCARWLSSESVLSGHRPSNTFDGKVQVFHRVQAPTTDLEKAAAEAKHHSLEISKWEQATKSLLAHPQSPTLQPGTCAEPRAQTTPQGATTLGQSSKELEIARHAPSAKQHEALDNTSNKVHVAPEPQNQTVAPPAIDEIKIRKGKEMIAEGLGEAMDSSTAQSSAVMRSELANAIVDAILALNVDAREFSEKIRHLKFNLRKNGELRASVLEGTTAPSALVIMKSEEMETKEQAEKRRKIEEKSLEDVVLPQGDLVFGRNIDAALQLKREAQGVKEPRYSDADTLNNSNGRNNDHSPPPQPKAIVITNQIDNTMNEEQPRIALKRKHDADMGSDGSDSDSIGATGGQMSEDRPKKKAVKFNAVETTNPTLKVADKHIAPSTVRNGIVKHQSIVEGNLPPSTNVYVEQIDWGAPIEHVDPGGWQAPPILANRGRLYQGHLKWLNLGNRFQVEVEVVGFQPQAYIRLPSLIDVIESITFDEMREKIEASGARPWNLHRAWIVGPKMPDLFGRTYLESIVSNSLELETRPNTSTGNANEDAKNEQSYDTSTRQILSKLTYVQKLNATAPKLKPEKKRTCRENKNLVGNKARINTTIEEALEQSKTVGRILINLNGEVLGNYNEGWTKGCHYGWELFIMEPTVAACEAASALLQEGNAARKSHALLMIAVPHYWGELLPLGENGIRQGLAGSRRLYVSASGAITLHKLPKIINCDLRAHRSRLNLNEIWDSVFGEQGIRLYPRQPTRFVNPDTFKPSNFQLDDQEEDSDEDNQKNVTAFEALEKRLREGPHGADALICQRDVPNHLDLAVAGPPNANQKKILVLGCWNRKLVPGVGHYAIDIREPKAWIV